MSLSDLISIIQTALVIMGFIVTYGEFKKWREELLGSKKIEVALRLGRAANAFQEAFAAARFFARSPAKRPASEYSQDISQEERLKQDRLYDFEQLLSSLRIPLHELYAVRTEISILFDDNEQIREHVKMCNGLYMEFAVAVRSNIEGRGSEEDHKVMFARPSGTQGVDLFGQRIEDATNELLKIARKHTRSGGFRVK